MHAEYPRFQAIYNGISSDGARLVLLLRLSPLVPFSLLNYGLGEPAMLWRCCSSELHAVLAMQHPINAAWDA